MADDDAKKPNGLVVEGEGGGDQGTKDVTLYTIFSRLIAAAFFPIRVPPHLCCRGWTRRGSPLRALLVVSVGTISFLALTGLLVFMLFFIAATVNAIVISLLVSLAAAGGFLAIFFTCAAVIYVGALAVAVFAISTATISAVIAVLVATGWIGFFWTLWLAAKKTGHLAKQSVSMTGSAVSAYSTAWHARNENVSKKSD
ncbi:UNVERIFIED_CONTAM: hypothetical protein Slati_0204600 [Sesamum latifolium]|uniref:Uncharacterized protein n=1 Tax=Sesamum latifolium TaxID=2727402 RepID=A0AAW2YCG1_9LAMI